MDWNRELDILLICDYNVEKTFFLEKIGSGDYYRELIKEKLIEEIEISDLDKKFFCLLDSDSIRKLRLLLNDKRQLELHSKCIEYYKHKIMYYDFKYKSFSRYANRYINLIGHYFKVSDFKRAEDVLKKIGLNLYKWGFSDYLRNILFKFPKFYKTKVINNIRLLYILDNLPVKIQNDEFLKILKETLKETTFEDLFELQFDNNDIVKAKSILKECLNLPIDIERFITYKFLKSNLNILSTKDYLEYNEYKYMDSIFYLSILNTSNESYAEFYNKISGKDPYFDMIFLERRYHDLVVIMDSINIEEISDRFILVHISMRLLKFDLTLLYLSFISGLIANIGKENYEEMILKSCNIIMTNKSVRTYKPGNIFFKKLYEYHKNKKDYIVDDKRETKLDLLYKFYRKILSEKSI